jgi:hypothetical protein
MGKNLKVTAMLESFRDLLSSSATIAAQRVRNPALGAFALSWCAFNWKSILYLLFSDSKIFDKIEFISAHSSWKTAFLFPCISVIVICGALPWANNLISAWQAKPLDNNDSIENQRKAKQILRSTRLRRLEAKRDVTYEKVRTGDEINIQQMKEQITQSQERMGEITAEKDMAVNQFIELSNKFELFKERVEKYRAEANHYKGLNEQQKVDIENLSGQLKAMREIYDDINNNRRASFGAGDAINALKIGAGLRDKN